MRPPTCSPAGGALASGVAALLLLAPIAWCLFAATVAMAGCLFEPCENARADLPSAALWLGLAIMLIADVILWGIAGYRRMSPRWVVLASTVLMAPVCVYVFGRFLGAF